jgi:hypothetical protein
MGGSEKVDISLNKCVDLLGGGVMCYSIYTPIASQIENSGYYDWIVTPPGSYTIPGRYKIRVKNVNATSTEEDVSDDSFWISSPPEIKEFYIYANRTGGCGHFSNEVIETCELSEDQDLTMNWWPLYSNKCEASGDWSGSKAFSNGPFIESLGMSNLRNAPKTYTLTCSSPSGSISKSFTFKYKEKVSNINNEQYNNPTGNVVPAIATPQVKNEIAVEKTNSVPTMLPTSTSAHVPIAKPIVIIKKETIPKINTDEEKKVTLDNESTIKSEIITEKKITPKINTDKERKVAQGNESITEVATGTPITTHQNPIQSQSRFTTFIKSIFDSVFSIFYKK